MEERRQRREEMICVRVAHSLILRLTPIFILNLPSADYLISDIEHLKKSFISAIFWIAGSTMEKLRRSIVAHAQRLPPHQIPEMTRSLSKDNVKDFDAIIENVLKWFSWPSNNKWLLIFDNVDHEYSAVSEDPEAFDFRDYLPEADQGSIIITSRLAGLRRLAGRNIKLEPFDRLQGELL